MTRRAAVGTILASAVVAPTAPGAQTAQPFSFDWLKAEMKGRSTRPDAPPPPLDTFLDGLTYDDYRNIYFRPAASRWAEEELPYQLQAFHPGWLFQEPVQIFEVVEGAARPLTFSTADYEYRNDVGDRVPDGAELSGVAGLKVNAPLNTGDKFDELITFLGASYFRALGRATAMGCQRGALPSTPGKAGRRNFHAFPRSGWCAPRRPTPRSRSLPRWTAHR